MTPSSQQNAVAYSVVIPFYNEEGSIGPLLEETDRVMREVGASFEIVAVDDGSTDGTPRELASAVHRFPTLRNLRSESNRGQSAAFLAGFRAARGEVLITMDGDGQNPPAEIPRLLAVLENADFVCGRRVNRRDSPVRRWTSAVANTVRRRAVGDRVHDTGCSLKAFRREVAASFLPFRGVHRFLPALATQAGWRVAEADVEHRPRAAGTTKYSFRNRGLRTVNDTMGVRWLGKRRVDPGAYREQGAEADA